MTKQKEPQWEPSGDTFISRCDVKGCAFAFHRYAIHCDLNSQRVLITDMDGNPEYEIERGERTPETQPDTWRDYCASVAETGNDYLSAFIVPQSCPQTWTVKLSAWLGARERGLRIVQGRRAGHSYVIPLRFPKSVLEYLEADTSRAFFTSNAIHSFTELKQTQESGGFEILRGSSDLRMKIRFRIDVAYPAVQIKRKLMKLARRGVRRAA